MYSRFIRDSDFWDNFLLQQSSCERNILSLIVRNFIVFVLCSMSWKTVHIIFYYFCLSLTFYDYFYVCFFLLPFFAIKSFQIYISLKIIFVYIWYLCVKTLKKRDDKKFLRNKTKLNKTKRKKKKTVT